MISLDSIRAKIADDDIEGLFQEMECDADFMSRLELLLLRWRYTHLKKQIMGGLLSQDQANLELSKIRKGLLDLAMGGKSSKYGKRVLYIAIAILLIAFLSAAWQASSSGASPIYPEVPREQPSQSIAVETPLDPLTDSTYASNHLEKPSETIGKLDKRHHRIWLKNHMEKYDKFTAGKSGGYSSEEEAARCFQNFVKSCGCDPEDLFGK